MNKFLPALALLATFWAANVLVAQTELKPRQAPSAKVLDKEQWKRLDDSVERGLEWLADATATERVF